MTKEIKVKDRILKPEVTQDAIDKKTKSRNRSSTGCLTCRKRKKKCDEKLYPKCLNCQGKGLNCEWTDKVRLIHEHLSNVRYYGDNINVKKDAIKTTRYSDSTGSDNDNIVSNQDIKLVVEDDIIQQILRDEPDYSKYILDSPKDVESSIKPSLLTSETPESEPAVMSPTVDAGYNHKISESDRKKDFLKRIAMQQDCVDDI